MRYFFAAERHPGLVLVRIITTIQQSTTTESLFGDRGKPSDAELRFLLRQPKF